MTDDYLAWWRGMEEMVQAQGAKNLSPTLSVSRSEEPALQSALEIGDAQKPFLLDFSIFSLPIETQSVYRVILLVPIGVFVLVILRNVIGIRTFGTFMPVLIALAFRETQLSSDPPQVLGKPKAVDKWLVENATEFSAISARRLEAGLALREKSIRRNMTELVDSLASESELLPCQAAERISLNRLTAKEKERTAKDIMEPMPTIGTQATLADAAALIVESQSNIVAVLSQDHKLAGILTTWDITRATAESICEDSVERIMTKKVISADPAESILDIVTDLEQNQISAMPIVEGGKVPGMVSSDLLAQRYLLRLLRSQTSMS